jgi:hypothetical protein
MFEDTRFAIQYSNRRPHVALKHCNSYFHERRPEETDNVHNATPFDAAPFQKFFNRPHSVIVSEPSDLHSLATRGIHDEARQKLGSRKSFEDSETQFKCWTTAF